MDLNNIPVMVALKQRLGWLKQRQEVIAENVANADTPGYKARDLETQDFSKLIEDTDPQKNGVKGVTLLANRAGHVGYQGAATENGQYKVVKTDAKDTTPTGNTVLLEDEMMKMNQTQIEYGMITNLYRKNVALLKSALGKGR